MAFRERVLAGLLLKIDSGFRALIHDCRGERGEAMHHLKTMAEAMICFYAVLADLSDSTAERLMARLSRKTAEMMTKGNPDPDELNRLIILSNEELRKLYLLGGKKEVGPLLQIVNDTGLADWYWRVYALACEAAHLGDLSKFMPPSTGPVTTAASSGTFDAATAAHYGLRIVIAILTTLSRVIVVLDVSGWESRIIEAAKL